MGKHEVIQVAAAAIEAGIGHEVALMGKVVGQGIELGGYSIWLEDEMRRASFRFDQPDEALAWIASRKEERSEYGR